MIIPKIGFILHLPDLYSHYKNILSLLPKDSFDCLVYRSFETGENRSFLKLLRQQNYRIAFIDDLLGSTSRYLFTVSNHYVEGQRATRYPNPHEQYLPRRLGVYAIKHMYGVSGDWSYEPWNGLYDLILCHGPNSVERLAPLKGTVPFEMGYPRYDRYWRITSAEKQQTLAELGGNPDKKTIVWLPTCRKPSSIDLYASAIADLASTYNVIVKPHPLTVDNEPERMALLRSLPFTHLIETLYDNTRLQAIADFIFADYGGSAGGAVYLDKALVLLNVPGAEEDAGFFASQAAEREKSFEFVVRKELRAINPDEAAQLAGWLADTAGWEIQHTQRARLRNSHFSPFYGSAASVAAYVLSHLDRLMPAYRMRLLETARGVALPATRVRFTAWAVPDSVEAENARFFAENVVQNYLAGQSAAAPEHAGWLMELGLAHKCLGQLPRSQAFFERACAADPENIAAWLYRADGELTLGRLDSAAGLYAQALEKFPDQFEILLAAGQFYFESGNTAGARQAWQAAAQLDPYDDALAAALGRLGA